MAPSIAFGSDTDADGLMDLEENRLGLNRYFYDTDGDGLSDYNEIRVLFTDPNELDTDGDGFLDSIEVHSASDPLNFFVVPVDHNSDGVPDVWFERYLSGINVVYGLKEEFELAFEPSSSRGFWSSIWTSLFSLSVVQEKDLILENIFEIRHMFQTVDTDGDGLTDADELKYGTNPSQVDTDGDGAQDGAEIYDYRTDPTQNNSPDAFLKTQFSNLDQPNILFTDSRPLLRGTSFPNQMVELIFIPLDVEQAARSFLANIFEGKPRVTTERFQTDSEGKFLIRPFLQDGRYVAVLRALDPQGAIVEESYPYEFEVDSHLETAQIQPLQLADASLNDSTKRIRIGNDQPYFYAIVPRGQLVTSWQSQLFTSSILNDSQNGEVVVLSPELDEGAHGLFAYVVDPETGIFSKIVSIDFEILSGEAYKEWQAFYWGPSWIFGAVFLLLSGVGFIVWAVRCRMKRVRKH